MAIFVDDTTKVLVQGLTGGQGRFHGLRNRAYGTQVVAGVTPGKAGQDVEGIPVFDTVADAVAATGANASFISVPPKAAPAAILEAAEAGVPFVVCITEGIPAHDEARVFNTLQRSYPGTRLLGPNCPGIISPGKCNIGITAGEIAEPGGPVGIVSRSGTLTYQALYELKQKGIGVTTCVGIGGDPVPGTSFIDCLREFQADRDTQRGDDDRRDRRLRRRGGGGVHRGRDGQAGRRVRRGCHRAGGQEDGPRRRDRLGRQGHCAGKDGCAGRGRCHGRAEPDGGRGSDGRGRRSALTYADGGGGGGGEPGGGDGGDGGDGGAAPGAAPPVALAACGSKPIVSITEPTMRAIVPSNISQKPIALSKPVSRIRKPSIKRPAKIDSANRICFQLKLRIGSGMFTFANFAERD